MITRCPACRTAFRVTQAQLNAREGKVRCGRCAEVFDARIGLRAEPASGPPPAAEQTRELEWPRTFFADAETVQPQPGEREARESQPPIDLQGDPAPGRTEPRVEFAPANVPAEPEATTEPPVAGASSEPEPERSEPASVAAAEVPLPAAIHRHPRSSASQWYESPVTIPERSRSRLRGGWLAGSVLLLLALAGQLAFHFRGELVLVLPEAKPFVSDLCAWFGCDLPLPRRAELMSIESSDLQADPSNPGVMVLSATLRNRAPFPQSYPALELTLTDTRDQALARRVLTAPDYIARAPGAESGIPGNSELPVKVFMETSSIKPTGYRLYLFYP